MVGRRLPAAPGSLLLRADGADAGVRADLLEAGRRLPGDFYPSYIEQVRPELNGLFREEDYPSADTLRKKFGVKLEVLPIPSGDDFRVTLSAEEQARVAREIDANVRQSLQTGTEDLWNRLKDVVSHMVERLNEPESRFHASLVTNVFELVDLLPQLNVGQDEELNRFAAEIRIGSAASGARAEEERHPARGDRERCGRKS